MLLRSVPRDPIRFRFRLRAIFSSRPIFVDEMIRQGKHKQRNEKLRPKAKHLVGIATDYRLVRHHAPQIMEALDVEKLADELSRQHPHQQPNAIGNESLSGKLRMVLRPIDLAKLDADYPEDAAHSEKHFLTSHAQTSERNLSSALPSERRIDRGMTFHLNRIELSIHSEMAIAHEAGKRIDGLDCGRIHGLVDHFFDGFVI